MPWRCREIIAGFLYAINYMVSKEGRMEITPEIQSSHSNRDIDPLLFLCYLLTDTKFLGKSTRRANATNHYSYF